METRVKNMICTVCPVGCRMEIETTLNGFVKSVSGNTCPRGKTYAVSETENPTRTLTSTVKIICAAESMLPVKTSSPIPKSKLMEAMKEINAITVSAPIKSGDIIIEDLVGTGINLVAAKTVL